MENLISFVKNLIFSRFGKVAIAGGFGAISQLGSYAILFQPLVVHKNIFVLVESVNPLGLFSLYPRFFLAQLFAIEIGVFVSFYINNTWAFNDKKLVGGLFVRRFLKNHLVVLGAIIIQLVIAQILASAFGMSMIKDYIYQIIGIIVGLFWNFYFYQRAIWKTK